MLRDPSDFRRHAYISRKCILGRPLFLVEGTQITQFLVSTKKNEYKSLPVKPGIVNLLLTESEYIFNKYAPLLHTYFYHSIEVFQVNAKPQQSKTSDNVPKLRKWRKCIIQNPVCVCSPIYNQLICIQIFVCLFIDFCVIHVTHFDFQLIKKCFNSQIIISGY